MEKNFRHHSYVIKDGKTTITHSDTPIQEPPQEFTPENLLEAIADLLLGVGVPAVYHPPVYEERTMPIENAPIQGSVGWRTMVEVPHIKIDVEDGYFNIIMHEGAVALSKITIIKRKPAANAEEEPEVQFDMEMTEIKNNRRFLLEDPQLIEKLKSHVGL